MRSAPPSPITKQARILLVDDNRDGCDARRALLEELGYEVVCARCGLEALIAAAEQNFDLIITDFRMEPMDGLELIRKLRESNFQNAIILLTGFAESLGLNPETTGATVVIQKSSREVSTLIRHTKRLLQPPRKPVRSQQSRASASRSAAGGSS
jgi:CheY-like chemotaxis protein